MVAKEIKELEVTLLKFGWEIDINLKLYHSKLFPLEICLHPLRVFM